MMHLALRLAQAADELVRVRVRIRVRVGVNVQWPLHVAQRRRTFLASSERLAAHRVLFGSSDAESVLTAETLSARSSAGSPRRTVTGCRLLQRAAV